MTGEGGEVKLFRGDLWIELIVLAALIFCVWAWLFKLGRG